MEVRVLSSVPTMLSKKHVLGNIVGLDEKPKVRRTRRTEQILEFHSSICRAPSGEAVGAVLSSVPTQLLFNSSAQLFGSKYIPFLNIIKPI